MNSDKEKEILVKLLQTSFTGVIDASSNFNPAFLADAIIKKLQLNETIKERNAKDVDDAVNSFTNMIDDIDKDMDTELEQIGDDEVLLKNFVKGQKTACEKLKESIEKI